MIEISLVDGSRNQVNEPTETMVKVARPASFIERAIEVVKLSPAVSLILPVCFSLVPILSRELDLLILAYHLVIERLLFRPKIIDIRKPCFDQLLMFIFPLAF